MLGVEPKKLKGRAAARSKTVRLPARDGRIARERKAAVLKAALRVFLKKGLAATSVSDIIAEAGGSKASLYGHFPSKECLFVAVMRHQIEAWGDLFLDLSDATASIEARLSEIGAQFLELVLNDSTRALQRIVAHEASKFPELGQLFLEHGPNQVVRPLSNFIRRTHENGDLCAPDPEMAAWQFVLLCQAKYVHPSVIAGMTRPSKNQCQQGIDAAVRTFMAAYGTSPGDRAQRKLTDGDARPKRRRAQK